MAVPVLITPLEVEEERDFSFEFKRKLKATGASLDWATATYEVRVALDSAGNYPVATFETILVDDIIKLNVSKAQNNLKGSHKYYCDMVYISASGTTYTEFKFIFNCSYSI